MRTTLKNWWKAVFPYPQRTIKPSSDSYDEYWEARGRKEVSISPWQKERADIALSLMNEKKDEVFSVLDIGCGDGAVLQYIRTHRENVNGVGIDFSKPVLERVTHAGFETTCQDIADVKNLSLMQADYAILFEIIEHVRDSELLVEKALNSTRKGVFISIPNSGFFTNRLRLLFGKFPMQWVVHPNEHIRFWTLRDVRWWLKALGWGNRATVKTYQGVPILKNIIPSLFAAGILIYIAHE